MHRTLGTVLIGALLVVIIGGCSDHDSTSLPHGMDGQHMSGEHMESSPVEPGAREIEMDATSFEFDPKTLRIAAGEPFTIVLTSDDVEHDFDIEGQDGHVAAAAGKTERGGFQIDEPGTYRYTCTVSGHRGAGMEGTIVVD